MLCLSLKITHKFWKLISKSIIDNSKFKEKCINYSLNGNPDTSIPRAATSVQIKNLHSSFLNLSKLALRSCGRRSPCKHAQEYIFGSIWRKYRSRLSQSNFVRQNMMALEKSTNSIIIILCISMFYLLIYSPIHFMFVDSTNTVISLQHFDRFGECFWRVETGSSAILSMHTVSLNVSSEIMPARILLRIDNSDNMMNCFWHSIFAF